MHFTRCGTTSINAKATTDVVSVLRRLAAADIANIRLSRHFRGLAIFDFFNNIGTKRTSIRRWSIVSYRWVKRTSSGPERTLGRNGGGRLLAFPHKCYVFEINGRSGPPPHSRHACNECKIKKGRGPNVDNDEQQLPVDRKQGLWPG